MRCGEPGMPVDGVLNFRQQGGPVTIDTEESGQCNVPPARLSVVSTDSGEEAPFAVFGSQPKPSCDRCSEPEPIMPVSLDESYAYCVQLSRRTAKNFYYSFLALPSERFQAMCALYAFMRLCDDLGDDPQKLPAEREANLSLWQEDLERALGGEATRHPVFPALCDIVRRYRIPTEYLFAVIRGVRMDLGPVHLRTFAQLEDYCYHVAGVVGLCCVHVWGFDDPRALQAAIPCGLAFQLTNILRDLKEDAALGRIYLPAEDLERFGYTADDLRQGCRDERFRQLMQFEVQRTRGYYAQAQELFTYLHPEGRPVLEAMFRIYGGLLDEIERRQFDVFSRRIQLSTWRKLCVAARGIARLQWSRLRGLR